MFNTIQNYKRGIKIIDEVFKPTMFKTNENVSTLSFFHGIGKTKYMEIGRHRGITANAYLYQDR